MQHTKRGAVVLISRTRGCEGIIDIIFEIAFALLFEGSIEIGTNKKLSRWLRYPLLLLAGVIYFGIIALLILLGFYVLKEGLWRAMVVWALALAFLIAPVIMLFSKYKKKKRKR